MLSLRKLFLFFDQRWQKAEDTAVSRCYQINKQANRNCLAEQCMKSEQRNIPSQALGIGSF